MLDGNTERPDVNERYECATSASRLLLEEHRTGALEILVAAGWARGVGGELMRLHTAVGRVKPFSEDIVREHAATIPRKNGKLDLKRARMDVVIARRRALREEAEGARGRASVEQKLKVWAFSKGVNTDAVGPALTYFLTDRCPVCTGHGKMKMVDAPVLGKTCWFCAGKGKLAQAMPNGAEKVLLHIEYCLGAWRSGLAARLHGR